MHGQPPKYILQKRTRSDQPVGLSERPWTIGALKAFLEHSNGAFGVVRHPQNLRLVQNP